MSVAQTGLLSKFINQNLSAYRIDQLRVPYSLHGKNLDVKLLNVMSTPKPMPVSLHGSFDYTNFLSVADKRWTDEQR